MTPRRQTSVMLSAPAFEALMKIAKRWGLSRQQTVRRLIAEHIERQQALNEDTRLVHISTVLRYRPPRDTEETGGTEEIVGRRVAFRLEHELNEATLNYAFRFPGQARRQAHADYAGRPLTDALTTAIELQEPFQDQGLEELPSTLRHCEARGLWHLTIAATRVRAELEALAGADQDLRRELIEGGTAWHSTWRHRMALHIALELFSDRGTESAQEIADNRRWVGEQGDEFDRAVRELQGEDETDEEHYLKVGAPVPVITDGVEQEAGRGASAVWRAKRRVALERVGGWLTSPTPVPRRLVVPQPGWEIAMPEGWHSFRFPGSWRLPRELKQFVDERKVLRIDHLGNSALWPVDDRRQPIPGLDAVIAGAGRVDSVELAEALLVPTRSFAEAIERPPVLWPSMHPDTALDLGFIDAGERDALIASAEEELKSAMERTVVEAESRRRGNPDPAVVRSLRQAMLNPPRFARIAKERHLEFELTAPVWHWQLGTVNEALEKQATADQLFWLGSGWLHVVRRALEMEMRWAWWRGIHQRFSELEGDDVEDEDEV